MSIDNSINTAEPLSEYPALKRSPPPQSRKQKRLSKHGDRNQVITLISAPQSSLSAPIQIPRTSTATTAMPPPSRLLIASIGNPGAYLSTLHSAGHTVLFALSSALSMPLQKSARDWGHGLLAPGDPWTLWASPASMNASGAAVAAAWKAFLSQSRARATDNNNNNNNTQPKLVVLHDELEAPLGSLKVRPGSLSPKGHNGLKSIRERMPGVQYTRIGIGIGRPESREPNVVAGYVLRKMSREEKGKIEGAVEGVLEELRRLGGG